MADLSEIKFDENGLVPVIVQDIDTGKVLMLAYANSTAIEKTLETSRSHFWSRSRNKMWMKGEESGNIQHVNSVYFDCDADTLLYMVSQEGVACHTGEETCFFRNIDGKTERPRLSYDREDYIKKVFEVITDRKNNPGRGSYVSSLLEDDIERILKKIGEESSETIIAALRDNRQELVYELTDLWFHSLVLLSKMGLSPDDINNELRRRFGKSKEQYGQS